MTNIRVPPTARRAEVARLRTRRLTTRQIAERIGVSQSTIVQDLAALTEEWAKQQGDFNQQLTATLMDLDALQAAAVRVLEEAVDLDKLPAIDRAFKAIELRAKLRGLFPKLGAETEPLPTGPITVELFVIEGGNRQLVTNSQEDDDEDIIDSIGQAPAAETSGSIERRVHL